MQQTTFHDYLGLLDVRFAQRRLIVFCGCSGAGKSSYVDALLKQHADFRDRPVSYFVQGRPLSWQEAVPANAGLVVVDELLVWSDLLQLAGLLRKGHQVLAASHLSPGAHYWLRVYGHLSVFSLDRDHGKILRALDDRGIRSTDAAVNSFVRRYGANYIDLDMILENYQGKSFDRALAVFEKFNRVDRVTKFDADKL